VARQPVQLAGELPSVAVIVMTLLRSGLADPGVGLPTQTATDGAAQQVVLVVLLGVAALVGTELRRLGLSMELLSTCVPVGCTCHPVRSILARLPNEAADSGVKCHVAVRVPHTRQDKALGPPIGIESFFHVHSNVPCQQLRFASPALSLPAG
jgi:hypothetical protein